jgi:prepilin-type processing-associated H-X9-DG protein
LSNVKQISLGIRMYTDDYDEKFPIQDYTVASVSYPGGGTGTHVRWFHAVFPYVKNIQIFSCPSATDRWNGNDSDEIRYGINTFLPYYQVSLSEIDYPTETLLLADSIGGSSYRIHPTWNSSYHIDTRHNDGANCGFVDGHGKWLQCSDTTHDIDVIWDPR